MLPGDSQDQDINYIVHGAQIIQRTHAAIPTIMATRPFACPGVTSAALARLGLAEGDADAAEALAPADRVVERGEEAAVAGPELLAGLLAEDEPLIWAALSNCPPRRSVGVTDWPETF